MWLFTCVFCDFFTFTYFHNGIRKKACGADWEREIMFLKKIRWHILKRWTTFYFVVYVVYVRNFYVYFSLLIGRKNLFWIVTPQRWCFCLWCHGRIFLKINIRYIRMLFVFFFFFFKAGRGSGVEKGGTGQEGENWAGKNRGKRGRKQEKNGKNNRKEPGSIYGKNTGYFPERKRDPFTGKVRDISLKENGIRLREKYGIFPGKNTGKDLRDLLQEKQGEKKNFGSGQIL